MCTVPADTDEKVQVSSTERTLSDVLLRLSRVALHRSRSLDEEDPAALYGALHAYFALASARQRRAAQICLSRDEVEAVLRLSLGLLGEAAGGTGPPSEDTALRLEAFIRGAPLLSFERLREGLRGPQGEAAGPLLGRGMAEVVELCRLLDERLGLPRAPLGAVHPIHLAAVAATLLPVGSLGELALVVAEASSAGPTPPAESGLVYYFTAAIYYEWGILDPQRREGLHALSRRCTEAASDLPSHPQMAPSLVDLVRTPASVEEKKLMSSAADPTMAAEHFTQPQPEDRGNANNALGVVDKEKTPSGSTDVMDTAAMSTSRAPSTSQDEEPIAGGVDYRFWMDLAS